MRVTDGMPPRYLPDTPLPPYAYVPGRQPHPVRDPRGHMHGHTAQAPEPVDPADWRASPAFLAGVDLFNHGYYWEAHESWEGLWRAYPPESDAARLLHGLIKLAAAGVKAHEGRPRGVRRHSEAAAGIFETLSADHRLFGLPVAELVDTARRLGASPEGAAAIRGVCLRPR